MSAEGAFKTVGDAFRGGGFDRACSFKAALRGRCRPHRRERPSHLVFADRPEIGVAWPQKADDGRPGHSLMCDDASLSNPNIVSLVVDETADGRPLIWSRPKPPKAVKAQGQARGPAPRGGQGAALHRAMSIMVKAALRLRADSWLEGPPYPDEGRP
ncbi:MAG: DUF736 family protein [Caulobacter sp.]|nr:DUF736 family protein [Caulobacter sp.]